MTHRKLTTLGALCALLVSAAPLLRAGLETHGSLGLGLDALSGDYNNAMFNQYKGSDQAARYQGNLGLSLSDAGSGIRAALKLDGLDLSPGGGSTGGDAASLGLELAGLLKLDLDYEGITHHFAEGAITPYDPASVGTGHLSLTEGAMRALHGATNANITGAMGVVTGTGNTVNPSLTRDRFKAKLAVYNDAFSTVTVSYANEVRKGSRPLGQSLDGTSVSIELLEPINYDTWDAGFDYAYKRAWLYTDLNYHHNQFEDFNQSLSYDNPFNAGGKNSNGSTAVKSGAVMGLCALPPSNAADAFGADVILSLPWWSTRLEGRGSSSLYTQNAPFVPYTTNTAEWAAAKAAGALAAPSQGSLNGRVLSDSGLLALQAEPLKSLRLKASSEYWEHDNQSGPVLTDLAYMNADFKSSAALKFYPTYENWVESKNSAGANWKLMGDSSLGGSYWHDEKGITGALANSLTEDGGKVDLDGKALTWLGWRIGGERSSRESVYYSAMTLTGLPYLTPSNIVGSAGDLTLDRMYDQADRDRDAASAQLTFLLGGAGTAVLGYTLAHDYYRNTVFGLLDDSDQSYSADVDIEVSDWLSLNPGYVYEQRIGAQRNCSSLALLYVSDPLSSPNTWTGTNFESDQTLSLSASITPWDKLFFNVGGAYTQTHGQMAFSSNGTWVPTDIVLDQSSNLNLNAKATYKVLEGFNLGLGYQYATFSYDNYLTDGQPAFNSNGGAVATPTKFFLVMDSQPVSYTVQSLMASADYSF